ncbi:MAG: leucine-rich repeat domain-containing protein [Clostridia bacterium]|nr:leucine-rich repeat domain-containing protein [Clostridia bacterium]
MKQTAKKAFTCILVVVMLLTAAPFAGFGGDLHFLQADSAGAFSTGARATEAVLTGSCGPYVNYVFDSEGTLTISGTGAMTGYMLWENMPESVISVVIENGVTSIGDNAFAGCTTLTSVTIAATVIEIGTRAFENCSSLSSVIFAENSQLTKINTAAFHNCIALTSINVPDAEWLGYNVFENTPCGEYDASGVRYVGNHLISAPDSIRGSYSIRPGTKTIGHSAFSNSRFESVVIPQSVTQIGEYAFWECTIMKYVSLPDSVKYIGSGAFYNISKNCIYEQAYELVNGIVYIGNHVVDFWGAEDRTSYSIRPGTKTIADSAFANSSSIKSISIPSGLTHMGDFVFNGCTSLATVSISAGVTSIGRNAFTDCSALTSINIPESVTSIGEYAFSHCSSLTSINIPDSITSINDGAFSGCSSLVSIDIPDSVTSIGSFAFEDCSSLVSIDIPDGVTSIDTAVFYGCSSLTSFTISDSVTSIGASAFRDCSALTSIVIPVNVKYIDRYAFDDCDSLKTIIILNPDCVIYDSKYTIAETATIVGWGPSTAKDYAEKYDRKFLLITIGSGHIPGDEATCTEDQVCVICGETLEEKLGHDYACIVTVNPTCSKAGVKTYTCENCGDVYTESIDDQPDHTPGAAVIENKRNATCTVNGSYDSVVYCTVCGTKLSTSHYTIVASHDEEIIPAVAATCTETGLTEGKKCSKCFETLVEQEIIEKIAHNEVKVNEKAPTATENGYSGDTICSVCGEQLATGEIIPATGEETVTCDHMCHKDGIMGFFWKIIRLFWKLFKMNPVCECGAAHY